MGEILNGRVVKNVISLGILQAGNYLLPLVMIPFLARALGLKTFGDWMFAVAFVSIVRTFVAYGYDMTATRYVSVHRDDRASISELYSVVAITRSAILVLSCLGFVGLALLVSSIRDVLLLGLLSMLVLVGDALFPVWLFQGMERMATITQVRLAYRALFVAAVILLVRTPSDVLIIPILEAIGSLAAGLIATKLAFSRYGLSLTWPSWAATRDHVAAGASVFVSFIAVHFYTTINTVLLGLLAGPIAVAQYSIAEKVYSAIRGMFGPIVQAIFPTLSRLHTQDQTSFRKTARALCLLYIAALIAFAIVLFVLADPIITLVAGSPDTVATEALKTLAIALCFALGTLLSPLLVIQDRGARLVMVTYATLAVNVVIAPPLIYFHGVMGAALSFLIAQSFQSLCNVLANLNIFFPTTTLIRLPKWV